MVVVKMLVAKVRIAFQLLAKLGLKLPASASESTLTEERFWCSETLIKLKAATSCYLHGRQVQHTALSI